MLKTNNFSFSSTGKGYLYQIFASQQDSGTYHDFTKGKALKCCEERQIKVKYKKYISENKFRCNPKTVWEKGRSDRHFKGPDQA